MNTKNKDSRFRNAPHPARRAGPNRYGSTSSMVVLFAGTLAVCSDERGHYATPIDRLNNGRADGNRHSSAVARRMGENLMRLSQLDHYRMHQPVDNGDAQGPIAD